MYAKNAEELRQLISTHPNESPSVFLSDGSFAAACYDTKTPRELRSSFHGDADPDECHTWNISAAEWKEHIEMALVALEAVNKRKGPDFS